MKKKIDFELALFIYAVLLLPKIGMLDLKLICLPVFLFFSLARRKGAAISAEFRGVLLSTSILIFIFLINALINDNASYLILFRYIRCIISMVCIFLYIKSRRLPTRVLIKTIIFIICLHGIAVLLCMILPQIRPFVSVLSGYNKKDLALRSSGLLSGYDFAGFLLNIGMIISINYNIKYDNKLFNFETVLMIVAIIFTSRFNTVFFIIQFGFIAIYMLKTKRLSSGIFILILVPIVLIGSVFTILTIDMFESLKNELIMRYDWIRTLNQTINMTYSGSSVFEVAKAQFFIDSSINSFIGNGVKAPADPGYINTIYEAGYLGLFVKTLGYLGIGYWGIKRRKRNHAYMMVTYIVLVTLLYEMKLVFCFASTSFELLMLFMSIAIIDDEIGQKNYQSISIDS